MKDTMSDTFALPNITNREKFEGNYKKMKHKLLLIIFLVVNYAANSEETRFTEPLILDGRPYVAFDGKAYRKDEAGLITSLRCEFYPASAWRRWQSLEGIEQLVNLKKLSISGENLDTVDFTPLSSLYNLETLYIDGNITHLPDLTGLERLYGIDISDSLLKSLEGIEQLVNLKKLAISGKNLDTVDFTPLSSLYNLETLYISGNITRLPDLAGLERLSSIRIYDSLLESLEGIKQLVNLKKLDINGENFDTVDFTPLLSLYNLETLYIGGNITRLPDLTGLERLSSIAISDSLLESLEGIGAPNVTYINIENGKAIDSFAPLNNLIYLECLTIYGAGGKCYRIADMANLPSLRIFEVTMLNSKIDLQGIENLSALKQFHVSDTEISNIKGIGKLNKLESLALYLTEAEPSLEFLRGMPNLGSLFLKCPIPSADYTEAAWQILDLGPVSTLEKLHHLSVRGFILKNIAAVDALELSWRYVDAHFSRLYDETEESRYLFEFSK
jgi:Leucine-rich repeat (LRR) protein